MATYINDMLCIDRTLLKVFTKRFLCTNDCINSIVSSCTT